MLQSSCCGPEIIAEIIGFINLHKSYSNCLSNSVCDDIHTVHITFEKFEVGKIS